MINYLDIKKQPPIKEKIIFFVNVKVGFYKRVYKMGAVKKTTILLCICIVACFSGCGSTGKVYKKDINDMPTSRNELHKLNDESEDNVYQVNEQEAKDATTTQVNQMQSDPMNVVDERLKSPLKALNIAIVVPTSGKYKSISTSIVESAMMAMNTSKYKNTGKINVYNIGQLPNTNWQEDKEVKRLIADNNDVIVGSVFEDTTKKLLSVLPEDKLFISFINKDNLAKNYPNLVIASMSDGYKLVSLLTYLKDYKRQFVSLILPATTKGYQTDKLFRKLAPLYETFIINSQFYQPKSKASITSAVRNVSKRFTATYLIDENGKFQTETYKQNQADKKAMKQLENSSATIKKTQRVETNAVYIDADEADLLKMFAMFEQYGLTNKNVQLFSNAIIDADKISGILLDEVLYIGYNYQFINAFNQQYKSIFQHEPNYFAYITYDMLSILFYMANLGDMLPRVLYNENGFRGILDEFRFTREGTIERRFGIYQIKNGNIVKTFVPEDYVSTDEVAHNREAVYK